MYVFLGIFNVGIAHKGWLLLRTLAADVSLGAARHVHLLDRFVAAAEAMTVSYNWYGVTEVAEALKAA